MFVDKALAIEPDNADAWILKGELLREEGNQKGALSAFEQALIIDPANVPASLGKATALIMLGEEELALA